MPRVVRPQPRSARLPQQPAQSQPERADDDTEKTLAADSRRCSTRYRTDRAARDTASNGIARPRPLPSCALADMAGFQRLRRQYRTMQPACCRTVCRNGEPRPVGNPYWRLICECSLVGRLRRDGQAQGNGAPDRASSSRYCRFCCTNRALQAHRQLQSSPASRQLDPCPELRQARPESTTMTELVDAPQAPPPLRNASHAPDILSALEQRHDCGSTPSSRQPALRIV